MRTEEDLFNQLAEMRLVCPCGMRCSFFSNEAGEYAYASSEYDFSGAFPHSTYNGFLDCIRRFVLYHTLYVLYSHYAKVVSTPKNIKIQTLPKGSEDILGAKAVFDTRTLKYYCDNCKIEFFKKFQLAENETELADLINKRLFDICAYLVSVKKNENVRTGV
jgi:hypothetical protein